jgi:hypothetical protein
MPDTYARETANWKAQALAQDFFDLFLVTPLLIITSWLAYKNNRIALLLWAGTIVYIIYTFVLFCFAVHFNFLFLIYCLSLGLSFYAFLYFLFSQLEESIIDGFYGKMPIKTVGYFLIAMAVLFYALWLSEIVPANINNTTPKTITETGLITNPVHVLDLSVFLPGLIFVAINLLKKKPWGLVLTPVTLTFMTLMVIAISTMIVVMKMKGIAPDLSGAYIMGVLALFSLILLIWYLVSFREEKINH